MLTQQCIYSDKCHFADARDDFGNIGPDKWSRAVSLLFNGDASRLKLTGDVVLDDKKRTVTFTAWRQVRNGLFFSFRRGAAGGQCVAAAVAAAQC
eukprot:364763-Chlamydomonas_euryale.AAC.5